MLHIVIFLGLAGILGKLYKPSESNMLFDGASLVLYMCGVTIYIANIVKGLRLASGGKYGAELAGSGAGAGVGQGGEEKVLKEGEQVLGREDSLKVLAASNTILALVLLGLLALQAGQWYAERKEMQEAEMLEKGDGKGEKSEKSEKKEEGAKGRQGSLKKKST